VLTIVIAVGAVIAIKLWVVNPYRIPSSSMEPTLHCGEPGPGCTERFSDRVLANRFIYHFKDPKRGDIIVFDTPVAAEERCGAGGTFVKRVVGLPGETINFRGGFVMVDGRRLDEAYLPSGQQGKTQLGPPPGIDVPFRIPTDHYLMLGDNRESSCDSREWGPVARNDIIGEVFAVYWPPQRIGIR
jgi:signal peptidase I